MSSDTRQKQKLISRSLLAGVVAHGGVAGAETHSETNSEATVTWGNAAVTRSVEFTAQETIGDVDVTVDFAKCANSPYANGCPTFGETFPLLDDVMFTIESPAGTMVSLIPFDAFRFDAGWTGVEPVVTFDDEADLVVNHDPNDLVSGTYQPLGELADFDGESITGTWTLHFRNLSSSSQPLAFNSFTVEIVPEPGPLAAALGAGAALAGLAARRRRRPDQPLDF